MNKLVEIDGSILEGGGQILRMALCFSALCKTPVRISKIRAGRSKPGLAAQHQKGIELLADICGAQTKGVQFQSTEIEFYPEKIRKGRYYADPKTAGSIALLIQVALPVAYFADGEVILDLKGGTNAEMAPQVDFMSEIFRPNLEKFGASFDFDLIKRGYFPKGGGHCMVTIRPVKSFKAANITDFGRIIKYFGWSFVAGALPIKVAHEMSAGAQNVFGRTDVNIEVYKEDITMANANCSGIILGCETSTNVVIGGSALGNRNENSFVSGQKAAKEITSAVHVGACVDQHVQDQLIIFMALADGKSTIRTEPLTLHTETAIYVAELMTKAKFTIKQENNSKSTTLIECEGIGLKNEGMY